MRLSIRSKLVLWNTAVLLVALAISGLAIHTAVHARLLSSINSANRVDAKNALSERESRVEDARARAIIAEATRKLDALSQNSVPAVPVMRDRDMRVIAVTSSGLLKGVPFDPKSLSLAATGHEDSREVSWNGVPARLTSVPLIVDGSVVQVAQVVRSLAATNSTMGDLDKVLWQLSPFALVASIFGAAFLSSRALRPIASMAHQAAKIEVETLDHRIAVGSEDELGRLAHAFNAMLDRLEKSFETQKQFTADAAHELRSPLTVIKASASLALSQGSSVEGLRSINRAADAMTRLVDDLLLLSRADAGQLRAEMESVQLSLLLQGVKNALSNCGSQKGVEVSVDAPSDIWVRANPDWLERILSNLLSNSIAHSGEGDKIRIIASQVGEQIQIVVDDTGSGISPEDLPKVFDRFYRADVAREGSGIGLGLSICRQLVDAMRGSIRIHSEEGRGTTVTILLASLEPERIQNQTARA